MKKLLLGAAALIAIAAPGAAAAQTTASAGIQVGNTETDTGADFDNYGLNAGFAHDFGGWTFQADGVSERLDAGGAEVGVGYGAFSAGVRNDSYALYGFLGHESLLVASGIQVGAGGQLYLGSATLNGTIGIVDFDGASVTAATVDGTWFFTPNFGLTGEVGYGEADAAGDPDWTAYGIGGTWRLTGSPVSFDFGYRQIDGDGVDADQWRLGLSFDFGTGTAQERSQDGPSFNGARRLYEHTFAVL